MDAKFLNTRTLLSTLSGFLLKNEVYHLRQEAFLDLITYLLSNDKVQVYIEGDRELYLLSAYAPFAVPVNGYYGLILLKGVDKKNDNCPVEEKFVMDVLNSERGKSIFGLADNYKYNGIFNSNRLTKDEKEEIKQYIINTKRQIKLEEKINNETLDLFSKMEGSEKIWQFLKRMQTDPKLLTLTK